MAGKMQKQKDIYAFLLLTIPTNLALLLYIVLGSYSRFLVDDYCVAAIAEKLGFFKSIWFWYKNWSGGYSTSILDYLLAFLGTKGISLVAPFVLLLWIAITLYVVLHALPEGNNISSKIPATITLTSLILFVTLTITPNVPQSLYWWTGMRAYTLPMVILTFYIGLYQWFDHHTWNEKTILPLAVISFTIIFLNSGFAETYTPIQFIFFTTLVALIIITKYIKIGSPPFYFLLSGLLGSMLGLIAMVVAPGNAVRQSGFPPPPGLMDIIRISANGYFIYIKYIFTSPQTITSLFGSTLGAAWFGIKNENRIKFSRFFPFVFLAGFFFAFLCFPSAAYGMSDYPPPRSLSFFAFAFAVFFILAGYLAGDWLGAKTNPMSASKIAIGLITISALLIGYSSLFSIRHLVESKPFYVNYAQTWDSDHAKILNAKKNDRKLVVIEPLYNWAQLQDPTDDARYWVNNCMKSYYGILIKTKQ